MRRETLLLADGLINLALGGLLVTFPAGIVSALGIPEAESAFYPSILGGVLFGVGLALLLERLRPPLQLVGLGLGGAVAINLCGGLVLGFWLVAGNLSLALRGSLLLWSLVVLLVGLSLLELYNQLSQKREGEAG